VKLGFHVSISGSIDQSFDRAQLLGCTAFQVFTRNPRTWRSKQLADEEVKAFRRKHRASRIGFVVSHMPYLPNLASPNEVIYSKSIDSLIEEVERCRRLGIHHIVTHIGSHVGAGADGGKARIVQALGKAIDDDGPMILLENGSGSGNHIGSRLEDIAEIIDAVGSSRVGFCLDTCHAYAAGYDIATEEGLTDMLRTLRKTVGFSQLRLVHLNDSVGALGSGVDHHDHIGLGKIGEDGFRRILASQLAKKPMIMETPVDDRRSDAENMAKVLKLAGLSTL
jgi:deoxyribonuclease IV